MCIFPGHLLGGVAPRGQDSGGFSFLYFTPQEPPPCYSHHIEHLLSSSCVNWSEERHAKEGPGCVGVNVVHLSVRSGVREQPREHTCHNRVTGARRMLKSCSAPS